MGVIEVNGIRVFAFHGCLAEEARIGGHFRVDVTAQGDFSDAEACDDLRRTVDYGRVTAIVREQMTVRSRLIEHAARRILEALRREWPGPVRWRVRLVKERPPVHGDVEEAVYTVEG
ncbi:MAG: dihydroneopterin aldolase [Flavobacteriales bacterium]|jgi:dihydroneopterin aldolase|nr:MAG: dihydroneopterin aldolase [Flavobacteriales bacterium]